METIKKKCKVVMLPTDEKTKILRNTYRFNKSHGNPLSYGTINNAIERGYEYQHLYIISDDEINVEDWVYTPENQILKFGHVGTFLSRDKKIISSTNPKLNLPAPSQSFIEKYCKEGGINEILVEYKKGYFPKRKGVTELQDNKGYYRLAPAIKWEGNKQKIVISKIKNSWSLEELENVMIDAAKANIFEGGWKTDVSVKIIKEWLNKNLNK